MKKKIVIFGSSRPSPGEKEYESARELGALLAKAGFDVVNGGYGGTMEALAIGAKEHGARTFGVTVKSFGPPNEYIDEEVRTKDLYDRLKKLIETGDAYIVLPGGSGTLLELSLAIEMVFKGLVAPRPLVVLGDFFDGVLDIIRYDAKRATESRPLKTFAKWEEYICKVVSPKEAVSMIKGRFP